MGCCYSGTEVCNMEIEIVTFVIPNLTFTDYEWFPWNICNGCDMPAGNAYPSGHLVPSHHSGTWLCSNCWDQIPRTCHVFTRFFTSNIPWYFSILLVKGCAKLTVLTDWQEQIQVGSRSVALRCVFDLKLRGIHLTEIIIKVWVNNGQNVVDVSICKVELRSDNRFLP